MRGVDGLASFVGTKVQLANFGRGVNHVLWPGPHWLNSGDCINSCGERDDELEIETTPSAEWRDQSTVCEPSSFLNVTTREANIFRLPLVFAEELQHQRVVQFFRVDSPLKGR